MTNGVMRLSEFIMIYLATAAPFGVARFIQTHAPGQDARRALARAAFAAFIWPLTAFSLFKHLREKTSRPDADEAAEEARVEEAKRALVNSLRVVEDIVDAPHAPCDKAERHAFYAAREAIERHVGLTLATRGVDASAAPTAREMELCRIAGRTGDDLLNAGRCVHRRNVTRLNAHRERARAELIHALAAARETAINHQPTPKDAAMRARVSEALIQAFARAIELLSMLEDRSAALHVARLLDAECAVFGQLKTEGETFSPQLMPSPRLSVPANGGLKA